ncbi:DUF4262 domain-containing protein [Microbacterium sp. BK668]|uniref:DUF4262 domain-containing protein n=1 Tax=Microbacterium sp. BK668 TaxID=2512118 RepID=UPI001060F8A5|nr:DUF4262 domain-containing protein [Microbacterium sp. BK668]TDN91412.1 uncharacterized protein DUF4262 [Microbacterium sp. BK668]
MDTPGEQALADLGKLVETYGWAIRHVLGDPAGTIAPFSYTVGLTARGWDELLITGLPTDVADAFIRNAVDEQASTGPFRAGDLTSALTESGAVALLRVEDRSGMTAARALLGDFQALQLVWPDSRDNLPWEMGYRNPPDVQPLFGADWPAS